ncbi:C-type mannose receptor 2-like [Ostrinia furnacalis]|uniref:C-type mannose receptor 2-like n=1 Tax=Ostrinia furnacalis TaxID=93504 RepID=UPI001038B2E6|nr:C-type mannose receptor 2-like [Ostrinia furnacalis]
MKVSIILVLVFIFYPHHGDSSELNTSKSNWFRPDYSYSERTGGWFKFHSVPATWEDARLQCYYEGAELVSPFNENIIQKMIMLMDVNEPYIFTGIHSTFSKGVYTSVGGVPLHEMPVSLHSRDVSGNCVTMRSNGRVEARNCSSQYPYICFKKGPEHLTSSVCGADQEYKYEQRTGSCYKFHTLGRTWPQAFRVCVAEGGHLAIINSDVEADVIRGIFQNYPDDAFKADAKYAASIGFQGWGAVKIWWTIHGQTLQDAGYSKWDKFVPDMRSTRHYCGAVGRNGTLSHIECEGVTFPAICEKKADLV